MMTKKKKIILITGILAVIIAAGVSAGIYLYINRFDAAESVQAVLATSYKNETDKYVEIMGTSQEEAEKKLEEISCTPFTITINKKVRIK